MAQYDNLDGKRLASLGYTTPFTGYNADLIRLLTPVSRHAQPYHLALLIVLLPCCCIAQPPSQLYTRTLASLNPLQSNRLGDAVLLARS